MLLDVQTNGSTAAASTGQTDDNPAAIIEPNIETLVLAHAAVKVGVREVTSIGHLTAGDSGANKGVLVRDQLRQVGNQLASSLTVDILVVESGEEGAAIGLPEVILDGSNARGLAGLLLSNARNDVQPRNNGPDTILLTDVVASGTETLLTTDGDLLVVEQGTEELPSGGDLVALESLGLSHKVDSSRSGHGSCKTIHTLLLEPGDQLSMVRDDSQAVTGGNEGVRSIDHVAVSITITGGTKVNTVLVHSLDQTVGVNEVGVGVTATEVWERGRVLGAAGRKAQLLLEDVDSIRTSHTMHAVEQNLEVLVRVKEVLNEVEVEDLLEHCDVVSGRVDDFDLETAIGLGANLGDIDIRDLSDLV